MKIFSILFCLCILVGATLAAKKQNARRQQPNAGLVEKPNPCEDVNCRPGWECAVTKWGRGRCFCANRCREEADPRAKVCSTQNVTYTSYCELERERCLCQKRKKGCPTPIRKKAYLNYYGACKKITKCPRSEMKIFPGRMTHWLVQVMTQMTTRGDLPAKVQKLADKERRLRTKGSFPSMSIIWKFCDLDVNKNKQLDNREQVALVAPLKAMEHCISPFVRKCAGRDRKISFAEWMKCFKLSKRVIRRFGKLCADM